MVGLFTMKVSMMICIPKFYDMIRDWGSFCGSGFFCFEMFILMHCGHEEILCPGAHFLIPD